MLSRTISPRTIGWLAANRKTSWITLPLALLLLGCQSSATAESGSQGGGQGGQGGGTNPTSFWVSASQGSDSNPGTSSAPFRTIGKCLSVATSGMTCNVLAGTYPETITPPTNGVTLSGAGASSVIVTTADPVLNWQVAGNGVYSAAVTVPAANTQTGPAWPGYDLFYAGVEVPQAQWPAPSTDPMHPNWATMAAGSTETTAGSTTTGVLYNSSLPTFTPSATTTVHLWSGSDPYSSYYGIPSSSSSGSVAYQAFGYNSSYAFAHTGGLFYITGAREFLSPNTWFYDVQNGVLYWQPPSGVNPNAVDVRFKQRPTAIDLSNRSNITVSGITFLGSGLIMNASSSQNVIDSDTFTAMATDLRINGLGPSSSADEYSVGVLLKGTGNTLQNSTISGSTLSGVTAYGTNLTITNNLISNLDTIGDYAAGLTLGNNPTNGLEVTDNTIFNVGRSAIMVGLISPSNGGGIQNIEIAHNHLYNTMMLSSDGGAIYGCCTYEATGSTIHDNWIHSGVSPFSITFPKGVSQEYPWAAFYWDNGSGGINFSNNVVWGSFPEIFINGVTTGSSNDITVSNNTDDDSTSGCNLWLSATINSATNFNVTANQIYFQINNRATAPGINVMDNLPSAAGAHAISGIGCSFYGCDKGGIPPTFPSNPPASGAPSACYNSAP